MRIAPRPAVAGATRASASGGSHNVVPDKRAQRARSGTQTPRPFVFALGSTTNSGGYRSRRSPERQWLDRQRNGIFHLAERKTRLDRGDAVEPGQLVFQKRFIRRQVGGDDTQQVIAVSRHQIALQNLVPFRNRLGEPVEVFLLLPRQLDRNEHADMQAERLLVDGGDIARDHAAFFEELYPAMARRD